MATTARRRGTAWATTLDTAWHDLRDALRALRRSPGVTAAVVVSLALGIGANTAIFSLLHALMLRPLPVRQPDQLVEVLSRYPGEPRMSAFWWRHYEHYRDRSQSFTDLVAVARGRVRVSGHGGEAESVESEFVSGNFFPGVGVATALGRAIGPDDDQFGAARAASAVVSWSFWTTRLRADPAAVGRRIVVNDVPITVVGVAAPEFLGLQVGMAASLWMPSSAEPLLQRPSRRADGTLTAGVIGRLKPGVSIDQALAELRVLDRYRLDDLARVRQSAAPMRDLTIELASAASGFGALRDRFATSMLVLMAIVALLLVLACANIASLLVARGAARQAEMALRMSLGAGRGRLVRQVCAESLWLVASGGVAGFALAPLAAAALARVLVSGQEFLRLPQAVVIPTQPDVSVLLFTAALVLVTVVLCSVAPAWHAAGVTPASLLRAPAAGESRVRRRFGNGLVVAQVALSVVLLNAAVASALYLSSLRNQPLGLDRAALLLVTLDPTHSGYRAEDLFAPYQQLLGRVTQIPGVRAATLSAVTPMSGAGASRFIEIDGVEQAPETRRYNPLNWVGPRYFETFGTPLVAGRDFTFADQGGPPVAIVNQSLARYYFGSASPLGRRFRLVGPSGSGVTGAPADRRYEIVGVVSDAKYLNLREPPPRTIYLHAFQEPRLFAHRLALGTTGDPTAVVGDVRRIVREELAGVQVATVTTMNALIDAWIVPERVVATLSGAFGALGALLVAVGLYGLLAFAVTRRVAEIGVRMALGATRADILRLVARGALGVAGAGVAIGVPLAVLGQHLARRVVDDLPAASVWTLVGTSAGIVVVALAAAWVPARRAARVDPADALRA